MPSFKSQIVQLKTIRGDIEEMMSELQESPEDERASYAAILLDQVEELIGEAIQHLAV